MSPSAQPPAVVVVAGPTAAGKTEIGVSLARRFGGELVGADSVQVYRGFDVGSAKPTVEELGGVAHHLTDVLEPSEEMDAVTYAGAADRAIHSIVQRGGLPIVVGGTGLWIRALLRGLVAVPPVDENVRAQLERAAKTQGNAALHDRLQKVDPDAAAAVHPHDTVRIVRALEVYEQTGQPLGSLRKEHALGTPRYRAFFLVLDPSLAELAPRIEKRAHTMFNRGFAEEVRGLLERYGPRIKPLRSVGYREVVDHVRGETSREETLVRIQRSTHLYARRQRNWFRREPGVTWTAPPEALAANAHENRIARWLSP